MKEIKSNKQLTNKVFLTSLAAVTLMLLILLDQAKSETANSAFSEYAQIMAIEVPGAGHAYLPSVIHGSPSGTYFISPHGDDNNSGASPSEAWATFDRAVNTDTVGDKLQPGDTLILMDGVYDQSFHPKRVSGEASNPITIKALNDGKAIIDGQGIRIPVNLEKYRKARYYVIEGIVAQNSSASVYNVTADNNTFRRVSGYDANTDLNKHVFNIKASYTLLEDCVASGTGRKMIMIYKGSNNTVRRCFANWIEWLGRDSCQIWPWGENINIYNASNNIVENSIGYGSVPVRSISVISNQPDSVASGNKVLGSISIDAGMNHDGTVKQWSDTHPQPSNCTTMRDFEWPHQKAGFSIYGRGNVDNNLFQDIFAWRSAGLGFNHYPVTPPVNNCQINRATIINNGLDAPSSDGGIGSNINPDELTECSITNSYIEGTSYTGEGARLTHRYVDGVLTHEPLWPWPMEDRIQAELGISVTNLITNIISQAP